MLIALSACSSQPVAQDTIDIVDNWIPVPVTLEAITASNTPTSQPTQLEIISTLADTDSSTDTPVSTGVLAEETQEIGSPDNNYSEHVVQRGENLTIISNLYDVPVDDLLRENNMYRSQVLYVGTVLNIPVTNITATAIPTMDTYSQILNIQQSIFTFQVNSIPEQVNDLNYEDFLVMPDAVIEHIREIYVNGQNLGRNPRAFTRIGDSTIEAPHFFYRFDGDDYNLGDYDYLQSTIDYYSDSFAHDSVAVIRGLHTWSVFDSMWSPSICEAGEQMLACEFRLHNPAMIIIRLGTNDRGRPETTRENFVEIINYCIDNGVIPILGTKADRFDGENSPVNTIIRELASEYNLPLWDFDLVANTLPYSGLGSDSVHLTFFYSHDWRLERGFTTGHGLHNLTGLIVLDEILQVLNHE